MTTAIPGQESAFEQDVVAYLDSLPRLLNADEGHFALVGTGELHGVFNTKQEAMSAGYRQFGVRGFLVQQIARRDVEMGLHWQNQ